MLIEFGIIKYKLLIPLMYPIFYQIRRYIHKETNPYYELFTDYLGYLFSGLIFITIKCRMKRKTNSKDIEDVKLPKSKIIYESKMDNRKSKIKREKDIINNYNQIHAAKKQLDRIICIKKYLFLLLLSFINLVPMPLETFQLKHKDLFLNFDFKIGFSLFFYIFFFVLFSRVILGNKIYHHQLFSLIIIILCIPILLTFYLLKEEDKNLLKLLYNSLILISILCLYSLFNVLSKKFYNVYMDSPYHLMFIIGLISLFILLLYECISISITGIKENDFNGIIFQIKKNYEEDTYMCFLKFIGSVLSSFILLAGIQLTIYFFTPCHFIISESLSLIITTFLENSLEKYNIAYKITIYIIYFIIAFTSLVYNEVIIINIGNLSKNTRKNIEKRELIEKDISLNLLNNEEDVANSDASSKI